ncbi:MAG: tRNA uridine(34) 5-carboxymethylaminomethyl modification radical SAM/GNAT enzyme Elp3 [Candidatus Lokiarchaeota archaeon]|nr:tRNA uridine(34) 5-carboxymethylaminomethyl modification radical SAM/GNAT enzyme Elp3 [Candidatus Lokiarchaeota archaeon]
MQSQNLDTSSVTEKKVAREIIEFLFKHPNFNKTKITQLKGKIGKKYRYFKVIKNATILKYAKDSEYEFLTNLLKRRITRTISGVTIVAIMTKPLPCPGTCIYCPGPNSQPDKPVAQSYTGLEPAAMRSIHNNYDPYLQVKSRIEDLEAIGHSVDKIELIVMGGTFLSTNIEYQNSFIQGALEGVIDKRVTSLNKAKKIAEKSSRTLVGLTIETRPDYCTPKYIDYMLNYSATRVEIGVQTVFDDIFKLVNRGHTTKESIEAIRWAKDAGLKVNAHIMPNLPGSNYSKDLELFDILFSDPEYKPDLLKIYPCLVVKGTELYNWWREGKYQPYDLDRLIDLIANVKRNLPPYVRIQRIMRDIPAQLIEAGCKKSNLRQLVQERLSQLNSSCNCIRCREYGISNRDDVIDPNSFEDIKLYRLDYKASKGSEIFLSYENKPKNYLIGYLRLRKPSEFAHRAELNDGNTMIVREIKVVGELVPKGSKPHKESQIQHRGFGKELMEHAEKISREEFDAKKLAVISGLGVKRWFKKMGYNKDGLYVSIKL